MTAIVEAKCQSKAEFDKYKLYVDELDKVMFLLLKISGRLARAENALMSVADDDDQKVGLIIIIIIIFIHTCTIKYMVQLKNG